MSRLQKILMELQQIQLDELATWMTKMEAKIESQDPIGSDVQTIQQQVHYHRAIETDMVEQVQRFDGLNACAQMIVQNVDNEVAVQKISSQLEELQERWERLVRQMEHQSKEDTENDIKAHKTDVYDVMSLGRKLVTELKMLNDPHEAFSQAVADLEKRWEELNRLLVDTQNKVDLNFQIKKFYDELHALQELNISYEKWVGTAERIAEEAMEISKQLEQCRVKLKAMKAHEDRVTKLNNHAEVVMKRSRSADQIQSDLQAFNEQWESAYRKISKRQQLLSEALEKAPPRRYLDAMVALLQWISDMEVVLETEKFAITDIDIMEKQLQQYKSLQADIQEQQSSLKYINKTGSDLISKAPSEDKAAKLDKDLKNINTRWSHVSSVVEERSGKLEKAIGQLRQYQNQTSGLNRWMDEMDVFLHAEDPATGDVPNLTAQMNESNVSHNFYLIFHMQYGPL
ncbi:hypothetical protein KUTeg_007546 [Tegillarca granosa]|uniref:Dystrophin n=1 Tax=Tegillarca granosa TaxID=220873 RepID=A0ABQ9FDM6_TEGGR|nr:hypothetical protein KUTeg_007546 [Tegillarca granosa]